MSGSGPLARSAAAPAAPAAAPIGRVLVTGGAGFIGSHLVERLAASGSAVHVIDNFDPYYDARLKWLNLRPLVEAGGVGLSVADVREPEAVRRAFELAPWDAVVHLAAKAGVRASLEDPAGFASVNVVGTQVVLAEAHRAGVRRVVVASSSSVYGDSGKLPLVEGESEAPAASSPYGATKRCAEALCATWAELTRASVTALRFFTVYGPRQRPDMAIHRFARLIEAGKPVPMYGSGASLRDYTFVADIVDGILLALGLDAPGHRVYNLGRGETVTLRRLIDLLMEALGKRTPVEGLPDAPGDVRATHADIARAAHELGYHPRVSLEQGLAAFVAWLRS